MANQLMQFNNLDVEIITDESGQPLFELYSTGAALGYSRWTTSKGKEYFKIEKSRINKVVENAEISTIKHTEKTFLDVNGLRKFISLSNTKKKGRFIDWLKENNYISINDTFDYSRKENILMDALSKILKQMGYTLELQRVDGEYRLDGYIKELDLVIEYDENNHSHYDKDKEHQRELYIKNKYSNLIRLSDSTDLMTNIGKVMNKIMEVA